MAMPIRSKKEWGLAFSTSMLACNAADSWGDRLARTAGKSITLAMAWASPPLAACSSFHTV